MMGEEEETEFEVINSWSAPRSLSTCLMYSFAQRDDTEVVDEPFYAHMLQGSGAGFLRPYREELVSKMDIVDGRKVVENIIFSPGKKKYRYCKHIANQRVPGTADLMKNGKHFILLRNPLYVLQSYDKVAPPSFLELGYSDLVSIYSELCDLGRPPPIVESTELQRDPEGVLRHLCEDLGISFQSSMLKWEAGPNPVDGIWGPMWYKSLHKTTGFTPPRKYNKIFPVELYDVLEQCLPFYDFLMRQKSRQTLLLVRSPLSEPAVPEKNKLFGLAMKFYHLILPRLLQSAEGLATERVPARQDLQIKEAIFAVLITNGMYHNAQVQVALRPGKNMPSGVSPGCDQDGYPSTLIVIPEWKPEVNESAKGVALVTGHISRTTRGAAVDVIILDQDGLVSETTEFNLFLVKKGRVLTPHADHYVPGIARAMVMTLVEAEGLPVEESRINLSELHNADEAWITGSMDELKPVIKIDEHLVGNGRVGLITHKIQTGFNNLMEQSGVSIPTD